MDLRQPLKRRRTSMDSFGVPTSYEIASTTTATTTIVNDENSNPAGGETAVVSSSHHHSSAMMFASSSSASHRQHLHYSSSAHSSASSSRYGSPVPQSICLHNHPHHHHSSHSNSNRSSPVPVGGGGVSGGVAMGLGGGAGSICGESTVSSREVEPDTPVMRLSRHVPNRDAMDMHASSFTLIQSGSGPSSSGAASLLHQQQHAHSSLVDENSNGSSQNSFSQSSMMDQQQQGGGGGGGLRTLGGSSANLDDANDSVVMYREYLAEGLVGDNHRGDVLKFGTTRPLNVVVSSAASANDGTNNNMNDVSNSSIVSGSSVSPTPHHQQQHGSFYVAGGRSASTVHSSSSGGPGSASVCHHPHRHHQRSESKRSQNIHRPLNLNPEKVLDAPDLPSDPCQLLDWGSNNQLVIGLRNTLYCWDAENGSARTVTDLEDDQVITAVSWLRGGKGAVMCQSNSKVALTDMIRGDITRVLFPAIDAGLSSNSAERIVNTLSVCGPLITAGTSYGTVCLYDVRAPHMVGHFDAHAGGVSKSAFCPAEPHYLATGGSSDGSVRLWDYRNTSNARYNFDRIHGNNSPVSALCFFSDKRSIVFSGAQDGTLHTLNTHGTNEDYLVHSTVCTSTASSSSASSSSAGSLNSSMTTHAVPVTGIVSSPGTGEIAVSLGNGGGVVQLRRAFKLQLIGQFAGPGTNAGINCLTLAPDGERVCGAQLDETLKFWKVFDRASCVGVHRSATTAASSSASQGGGDGGGRGEPSQHGSRGGSSANGGGSGSATMMVAPGQRIRQRGNDDDDDEFVDMR